MHRFKFLLQWESRKLHTPLTSMMLFLGLNLAETTSVVRPSQGEGQGQLSSVQYSCSVLSDSVPPMNCSMPGLPVHYQLPESIQIHVHWVSDAIQPSHPLSSPSPPALNLFQHQSLFKWVSSSYKVAKYWSFSFNNSPSNEHPGLISFRMDCLDLL